MSNPDTLGPARQSVGRDQASESSSAERQALATRPVRLTVNGRDCTVMVEPRTTLLDVLRGALSLTETKTLVCVTKTKRELGATYVGIAQCEPSGL
jgi:hypothetical protein